MGNKSTSFTVETTSKSTIQDLINQVMKQVILNQNFQKIAVLDIIYEECHPCLSDLFSSSGDFLLRISAIIDYTFQIISRVKSFHFHKIIVINDTYFFLGKNRKNHHEAWGFTSTHTKEEHDLIRHVQHRLNEYYSEPWVCHLYCLEDGDFKTLYYFES